MKVLCAVLLVVAIAELAECGDLAMGLRVKFAYTWSPDAGDDSFFNIPLNKSHAEANGWRYARRPLNSRHPSLTMCCPSDKVVCALYDDLGYVAGLLVALPLYGFANATFDFEAQGFSKWNTAVDGQCVTKYALQQYFVSEEYLAMSAADRLKLRDPEKLMQEGPVWLEGPDGLRKVPGTRTELEEEGVFTTQSCIPWMGRHYYYNMSSTTPCTAEGIYPWFPMTREDKLIATGFMVFGQLPVGDTDWFERPSQSEVELIVPSASQCFYDLAGSPGAVTMHVYYTEEPWWITCLEW